MFQLKIITDLSTMPKVVETNIDEVTPIIDAAIERTKGLVVTNDKNEIIAADNDAAKLRKMADAIKRFRIDHIAMWKEPMEAFETKCKTAEKRLAEAALEITTKTGEVKEIWRERKREKCREWFGELLDATFTERPDITASASVEAFFQHWTDPKTKGTWVNSSVSEASIRQAIQAEIDRMKATIDGVEANYADEPEEVKAKARIAMLEHFDMNDVIAAVNAWKREQAEIAARAEAERKRAEEAASQAAIKAATPIAPKSAEVAPKKSDGGESEKVETYTLRISGTRDALISLKKYGVSLGIKFENVNK